MDPRSETPEPVDRLCHIADVHFWTVERNPLRLLNKRFLGNLNVLLRRRRAYRTERVDAYADHIAERAFPVVLQTGDLTSTALDDEFVRAARFLRRLRDLGPNVIVIPGNHDVYTFESVRKRRIARHLDGLIPAEGLPARRALPGGTPLILVPTVRPNILSSRGEVDADSIAKTRALVEAAADPLIVAGHYPLLTTTHGYATSWSRRLIGADRLRDALGATGKRILYVCGHVHRFSYEQDDRWPNLQHLSTAAFVQRRPQQGTDGAFTEIHAFPDGFRVFQHVRVAAWSRTEAAPRPHVPDAT